MSYSPDAGDIVWINFSPQEGREQAGRRPALILSPKAYNTKVGLMLACPITSRVKGYPFEVALPADCPVQGVVLADQVRCLDWSKRPIEFAAHAPVNVLFEAGAKLAALIPKI